MATRLAPQLPLRLSRQCRSSKLRLPRAAARRALVPQEGQGLVEFALAAPLLLLLICAVMGFGILLENEVALNDAARSGARFAAAQPSLWSSSQPAAANSIQGAVQHSGSTISIATSNITIGYYQAGSGPLTPCGTYSGGSLSLNIGYPQRSSCLVAGAVVKVTVTGSFQLPVPLVSRFFPNGVTITASATAMEEQNG